MKQLFVLIIFISISCAIGMDRNNPRPFRSFITAPDKQQMLAGPRNYFISALLEKATDQKFIFEIIGPTKATILTELEEEKNFGKWETVIILEETDLKKQFQVNRGS